MAKTVIDAPLFRFRDERSMIVAEVARRSYQKLLFESRLGRESGIEYLLNDAAYQEIDRLRVETGPEEEVRPIGWWGDMSKQLGHMSEQRKRSLLRELCETYSEDVAGQFNPKVYRLATGALPIGLNALFKAFDLTDLTDGVDQALATLQSLRDLGERIIIEGEVDLVRKLVQKGTVVVVPTHSSNMDSILVGYSLWESGLPPVTYGAGKNLFTNPILSFFMHNLGAYKVDRRLRHGLYKEVLKIYSQVLIERGYHSLFFPGGTRCRSNFVEQKLKLGLLGTTIQSYTHNLIHKGEDRPIYIVPLTINYNLVLEAESLINEYLKRAGGSRYFRESRDEFDHVPTFVRFVFNTVSMDSTTVMRFGTPLDCFGNQIGPDGESLDFQGRPVSRRSYVESARKGDVVADDLRDREYTRFCGERVAEGFLEATVLTPAQIVGYVLFEKLRGRFKGWDVFRLLRFGAGEVVSWRELREGFDEVVASLRKIADRGGVHVAPMLREGRDEQTLQSGLEMLRMYHIPAILELQPDGILLNRLELLYFYGNRVRTFLGSSD